MIIEHTDGQPINREQLIRLISHYTVIAGELSSKAGDQIIFKQFGLNTTRYALLHMLIERNDQPKINELKDYIMKSQSNMTQVIDSLEKGGLVERVLDPDDRRAYRIKITDEGRKLMTEVETFFLENMKGHLSDWKIEDIQTGYQFLLRFIRDTGKVLEMNYSNCIPEEKY